MKWQFFRCFVVLFSWYQVSALPVSGQTFSFSDGFEGASLSPFWSGSAWPGAGIYLSATGQAHSGSQSVQLDVPHRSDAGLSHTFDIPVYGEMSVWVYESEGNPLDVFFGIQGAEGGPVWMDGLSPSDTYDAHYYDPESGLQSVTGTTHRTSSWHQLTISSLERGLSLSVDGNLLYTGSARPMTSFFLGANHVAHDSPDGPLFWDDFSGTFTSVPEPSAWAQLVLAGAMVYTLRRRPKRG